MKGQKKNNESDDKPEEEEKKEEGELQLMNEINDLFNNCKDQKKKIFRWINSKF